MLINRRIATGLATTALAVSGMFGAGLAVTPAHAAPATSHHCPSSKGKYPPGKCRIYLSHNHIKRHHSVGLQSGKVFKHGERVSVTVTCVSTKSPHRHFTKHAKTVKARANAEVLGTLYVGGHFPAPSKCTLTLHGHHSNITLRTTFHVRKG